MRVTHLGEFEFAIAAGKRGARDLLSWWNRDPVEIDHYDYLNMKTWSVRI